MNVQQAYNAWAGQYDTNKNRTRDLEAVSLRETLAEITFSNCLEIGCGTGKNTVWLADKAQHITAVDFSEEMLEKAKQKLAPEKVNFRQADITQPWTFADRKYDLITFSLVLEHIEHLEPVFEKVAAVLAPGGLVYAGELHPFKQYQGTKARFDTAAGRQEVSCFIHNASDFVQAAKKHGLKLTELQEYFDDDDRTEVPRILTLLFQK